MTPKHNPETLKFSCWNVGQLMTNAKGTITDIQLNKIKELEAKAATKGLTVKQQETLDEYIEKRDKPFELSDTAKGVVKEMYLKNELGISKPFISNAMIKGDLVEQDVLALMDKVLPSAQGFRRNFKLVLKKQGKRKIENDFFKGIPDIVLPKDLIVEDVKASWTIATFMEAEITKMYYGQLQCYMDILQEEYEAPFNKARLCYGFVDTPDELVQEEKKRYWYKFGSDEAEGYQRIAESIDSLHKRPEGATDQDMVTYFEFDYDPDYIDRLKERVEHARKYYAELCKAGFNGLKKVNIDG